MQNRGSSGEGIWIIRLKSGEYCTEFGDCSLADNTLLEMMEANDNHAEEHTVSEMLEFFVNGRSDKSGVWTSKGVGKYLEGGREAGGMLVDQRFLPRIVEGDLHYYMVGPKLVGIRHKRPKEGGVSAPGDNYVYTYYDPNEPLFKNLTEKFAKDINQIMPSLGLDDEPLPLWWTAEFHRASPRDTPLDQEQWVLTTVNSRCVGVSENLAACAKSDQPNAGYDSVSHENKEAAMEYGNLMGKIALDLLSK
jgi:hypothetical protein